MGKCQQQNAKAKPQGRPADLVMVWVQLGGCWGLMGTGAAAVFADRPSAAGQGCSRPLGPRDLTVSGRKPHANQAPSVHAHAHMGTGGKTASSVKPRVQALGASREEHAK